MLILLEVVLIASQTLGNVFMQMDILGRMARRQTLITVAKRWEAVERDEPILI